VQRIIIVDDHPLFRDALKKTLELTLAEPELLTFGNMEELTAHLTNDNEADLVLLDLMIPGVQGFSGLLQLREQHPALPVAIISATDTPETIRRCYEHGALAFIPKTLPIEDVKSAINTILDGETWMPEGYDPNNVEVGENAETIARLGTLTPQQKRVLKMLSEGMLNKQIAYELNVSEATIKAHVSAILKKLAVSSRTQAAITVSKVNNAF